MLKKLLTLAEASETLRVTRKTLRRWLMEGRIPGGYKVGDEWRLDAAELEKWLGAQKLTPEALSAVLAAPNGCVKENEDGSLEVNLGWPEAK